MTGTGLKMQKPPCLLERDSQRTGCFPAPHGKPMYKCTARGNSLLASEVTGDPDQLHRSDGIPVLRQELAAKLTIGRHCSARPIPNQQWPSSTQMPGSTAWLQAGPHKWCNCNRYTRRDLQCQTLQSSKTAFYPGSSSSESGCEVACKLCTFGNASWDSVHEHCFCTLVSETCLAQWERQRSQTMQAKPENRFSNKICQSCCVKGCHWLRLEQCSRYGYNKNDDLLR